MNPNFEKEKQESQGRDSAPEIAEDYPALDTSSLNKIEAQVADTEALWKEIELILEEGTLNSDSAETLLKLTIEVGQSMDWFRQQFGCILEGMEGHQRCRYGIVEYESMLNKRKEFREVRSFQEVRDKQLPRLRSEEERLNEFVEELGRARENENEKRKVAEDLRERLRREAEEKLNKLDRPLGLGLLPGTRRKNRAIAREARKALKLHEELNRLGEKGEEVLGDLFGYSKEREEARQLIIRIQSSSRETREQFESLIESYKELRSASKKSDEAERLKNKHAREVEYISGEIERRVRNSSLGGSIASGKFGAEVAKVREEAEKSSDAIATFEREIDQNVFEPLGISLKHEHIARAEKLPNGTPEVVAKVHERSFKNIREVVRSVVSYFEEKGLDKKELIKELMDTVERTRKEAFVGFNDDSRAIEDVLSDGEIRSAFHLSGEKKRRSSTGVNNLHLRDKVERVMGFRRYERPIYLALGSRANKEDGPAPQYGAFHLSYSLESLRGRAICTVGDSMNVSGVPFSMRRTKWWSSKSLNSASERQLSLEHGLIAKALLELDKKYEPKSGFTENFLNGMSYVEVQVLGTLSVDEASELVISKKKIFSEIEHVSSRYPHFSDYVEKLQRLKPNLTVRITGEPPENLKGRYNGHMYERWFAEKS